MYLCICVVLSSLSKFPPQLNLNALAFLHLMKMKYIVDYYIIENRI